MNNKVIWLRISYWAGAIGDFLIAIFALIPERMGVPSYVYPMGMMSAVAFSWGCMLIWADRKPVERKDVIMLTAFPLVTGLLLDTFFAIAVNLVSWTDILLIQLVYLFLIVLFISSYILTRTLEQD